MAEKGDHNGKKHGYVLLLLVEYSTFSTVTIFLSDHLVV